MGKNFKDNSAVLQTSEQVQQNQSPVKLARFTNRSDLTTMLGQTNKAISSGLPVRDVDNFLVLEDENHMIKLISPYECIPD